MTSPNPTLVRTPGTPRQRAAPRSPGHDGARVLWLVTPWQSSLKAVALIAMSLALSAPAAVLEYDEYLQRAAAATKRGDWQSVASQLAQAINHPDLPRDPEQRSAVYLAYGRAVGVSCQFDESEKYLSLAETTAKPASRSRVNALLELGTLSIARQHYAEAIAYLEQALQAEAAAGGNRRASMLIRVHLGLASALEASGRNALGATHREQAGQLQARESGGPGHAVAPYGARCPGS